MMINVTADKAANQLADERLERVEEAISQLQSDRAKMIFRKIAQEFPGSKVYYEFDEKTGEGAAAIGTEDFLVTVGDIKRAEAGPDQA